jgi:hypothetical protein
MKWIALVLFLVFIPSVSNAQVIDPLHSLIAWNLITLDNGTLLTPEESQDLDYTFHLSTPNAPEVTCTSDGCTAPWLPEFKEELTRISGNWALTLQVGNDLGTSIPSAPVNFTTVSTSSIPCPYAPPNSTTMTTKDIGSVVEGTNPSPQGTRILQLRNWGFRTEWAMATPTTMHVIAICVDGNTPQ